MKAIRAYKVYTSWEFRVWGSREGSGESVGFGVQGGTNAAPERLCAGRGLLSPGNVDNVGSWCAAIPGGGLAFSVEYLETKLFTAS
jgi:hypothetical protein